jgi:hypothetical protein
MTKTTVQFRPSLSVHVGVLFRNAAGEELHPTEDFPSWSVSDESIATINTIGTVNATTVQIFPTGVTGTITVTCSWNGVTANTEIEIINSSQPVSAELSVWTQEFTDPAAQI